MVEGPLEIAQELRDHLNRPSVCNFAEQTIASLSSDTGDTLAQVIRTHVRNSSGDNTQLKAATRLYLNSVATREKESMTGITRTGAQLSYPLSINYERNVVRHKATLGKCYTRNNNVLTFTRPAKILLLAQLNWGEWSGADKWDAPTVDPTWRFSSGGNNRTVTCSLSYLLSGQLAGGSSTSKILPQSTVFYEEEVFPAQVRQLFSVTPLDVFDANSSYGKIETLSFEVERSPYVISYGARTDHVGLFKNTPANVEDGSNYFEIIEL